MNLEAPLPQDLCEDEARCRKCRLNGKCHSWLARKSEMREQKVDEGQEGRGKEEG